MCQTKSMIVLKNRVFCPLDYDSHSDMLKELEIQDNKINPNFVKIEVVPSDGNLFNHDSENWRIIIDKDRNNNEQYFIPNWFSIEAYEERIRKELNTWHNERFVIGREVDIINTGRYYIDNAVIECVQGNAVIKYVHGNAVIKYVQGNAVIEYVHDNAVIKYVHGNAVIKYVHGNAVIEYVQGNAVIECVQGNAVIKYVQGNAVIEYVHDNAVIECVHDNAVIECVQGNAVIKYVHGNAVIKYVHGNAVIEYVQGNAVICKVYHIENIGRMAGLATARDVNNKIIYVADADYKLKIK